MYLYINLALLLIQCQMISTSRFAKTLLGFLIITLANAKWSISQIKTAFEGQFDTVELRSELTIRAYTEFQQRLKEDNISVPSFIENEKFGYDGEAAFPIYFVQNTIYNSKIYPIYILTHHQLDFAWVSTEFNRGTNIGGLSKEEAFLLVTRNDFPYDLQTGITHWLVWSNHEIQLDLVHQALNEIMSEQFYYYAFVNPHNKKSIPEIFHAQIFVQKRPQTDSDL